MKKSITSIKSLKKLFLICLFTGFSMLSYSQAPAGINYQAAIRDGSGQLIKSQNVNIKFIIEANSITKYSEEHLNVNTSAYGLVNLVIGEGTPLSGNFADVNWQDAVQESLSIEVDLGSGYVALGTQEFQSVPYALNNPWKVSSIGKLSFIDTTGNVERVAIETTKDLTSSEDLLSLSIPKTSVNTSQFIEFEHGGAAVAQIHADGSASFQHVELTDTAGPTNAPTAGAMYADNAPMAWGFIAPSALGVNINNDFGIASVTRTAAGNYTVTLDNDWDGEPAIMVTPITASGNAEIPGVATTASTNSFKVYIRQAANPSTLTESSFMVVVYGRPK